MNFHTNTDTRRIPLLIWEKYQKFCVNTKWFLLILKLIPDVLLIYILIYTNINTDPDTWILNYTNTENIYKYWSQKSFGISWTLKNRKISGSRDRRNCIRIAANLRWSKTQFQFKFELSMALLSSSLFPFLGSLSLSALLQCDHLQPCKKFLLITCARINYKG